MSERYLLSPRSRTWSRDGWHIYFDPQNFAWAKVNDSGRFILELCRSFMSYPQMASHIASETKLPLSTIEEPLRRFVNDMIASEILHLNEYVYIERLGFQHLAFPRDIYLHVTDKCNLKCSYCYNKVDRTEKLQMERAGHIDATLTTLEMKELLKQLVDNDARRILFTGGEPLLRPDLTELIRYTRNLSNDRKDRGGEPVRIELLTNAILISEALAEELCATVDTVTISLDGHEAHYHDVTRGKGTFQATVRGIRALVGTRQRLALKKPHVCMVPVISDENVNAMPEIYAYALGDLGVNSLAPILFQAGDHQEVSLAKVPSKTVFFNAIKETDELLVATGLAGAAPPKMKAVARHHCGVGSAEISIDAHGMVYPCQSLHYESFACGNIRGQSISAILLSSPVMQMVRGTTVASLAVCSHCDLRNLCNGGCRATAYNLYKEFDRHNEFYCSTLEQFAVERLWAATNGPGESTA